MGDFSVAIDIWIKNWMLSIREQETGSLIRTLLHKGLLQGYICRRFAGAYFYE